MSADPTPLAQRLVTQVARAISDDGMGVQILRLGAERDARKAVVAALRELDTEVMHRVVNNLEPVDLIAIADSIEKGGDQ